MSAIDPADVRSVFKGTSWSPTEWELIEKLAEEDEIPDAQLIREAVLVVLERRTGYTDTARRPAPRRRNYRRRGEAAGKTGRQQEKGTQR